MILTKPDGIPKLVYLLKIFRPHMPYTQRILPNGYYSVSAIQRQFLTRKVLFQLILGPGKKGPCAQLGPQQIKFRWPLYRIGYIIGHTNNPSVLVSMLHLKFISCLIIRALN